jgi:hypothetical protein
MSLGFNLRRLWISMLTANFADAGTNSQIEIIINDQGIDRLRHTFPDTPQEDQEPGQANLYEVNVAANNIVPENLTDSSIRVGIRGDDQWTTGNILVWGERFTGGAVIPLAFETNIPPLSTDASEGVSSTPLRLVGLGSRTMQINRMLLLVKTSTTSDAGTDDEITLRISTTQSGVDFTSPFPAGGVTSQDDLETGQANLYHLHDASFTKNSITEIRLETQGNDAWLPESFFLSGQEEGSDRQNSLVPLVHLPSWSFGNLSTDTEEGAPLVRLPLAPTP